VLVPHADVGECLRCLSSADDGGISGNANLFHCVSPSFHWPLSCIMLSQFARTAARRVATRAVVPRVMMGTSAVTEVGAAPPTVFDKTIQLIFVDPSGARRKVPGYVGESYFGNSCPHKGNMERNILTFEINLISNSRLLACWHVYGYKTNNQRITAFNTQLRQAKTSGTLACCTISTLVQPPLVQSNPLCVRTIGPNLCMAKGPPLAMTWSS
jgi:hypothetical protein